MSSQDYSFGGKERALEMKAKEGVHTAKEGLEKVAEKGKDVVGQK